MEVGVFWQGWRTRYGIHISDPYYIMSQKVSKRQHKSSFFNHKSESRLQPVNSHRSYENVIKFSNLIPAEACDH